MESSVSDSMEQVPIAELRGSEWANLMWGFFWRGLAYTLLSALGGGLAGGIAGGIIGAIMGASGSSLEQIRQAAQPVGLIMGLLVAGLALRLYLGWVLGARYGSLRLAVMRTR